MEVTPSAAWRRLEQEIAECRACPRLVEHRERVAREKRRAFADEEYWGRPVPGFGDPAARLVVVGLAPAAHGANRTGRMFTGDRSGDWLYRAMHDTGFANQSRSTHRGDGLVVTDAYITAASRCAPPANKPTPTERDACRPFLERELDLLDSAGPGIVAAIALGQFAYDQLLRVLRDRGAGVPRPKPRFGHAVGVRVDRSRGGRFPRRGLLVIASYHPSQQNTFTGKLTREMLFDVFQRGRGELGR